jgi:restriction endonuclease S subunit
MGNKKSLLLHGEVGEIYCSNEFHVLRAKEGIPSEYILYLIKSDIFVAQAKSKARGATPSRLRLHENDLPKLKVPKHTREEMEKLGGNYVKGRIEAADLISRAESLMSEVSPDF